LTAFTHQGSFQVCCTAGVTVGEFLDALAKEMRADCSGLKVFCVPAPDFAVAVEGQCSDEWAAELLGFKLEEPLPPEVGEVARGAVLRQKLGIIAKARRPMGKRDRINLRVRHLWAVPPEMAPREAEKIALGEGEELFTVEVTVQRADVKTFLNVSSTVQARLAVGSPVSALRRLFGDDLPAKARILEDRPGRGLMQLLDSDPLPEKVTLTDFTGRRGFYMAFTKLQAKGALTMMKAFFEQPQAQTKLDEFEKAAKGVSLEFRAKLSNLLTDEVYPPILEHYGIPTGAIGSRHLQGALADPVMQDLELAMLWLQVEMLMRNSANVTQATQAIKSIAPGAKAGHKS